MLRTVLLFSATLALCSARNLVGCHESPNVTCPASRKDQYKTLIATMPSTTVGKCADEVTSAPCPEDLKAACAPLTAGTCSAACGTAMYSIVAELGTLTEFFNALSLVDAKTDPSPIPKRAAVAGTCLFGQFKVVAPFFTEVLNIMTNNTGFEICGSRLASATEVAMSKVACTSQAAVLAEAKKSYLVRGGACHGVGDPCKPACKASLAAMVKVDTGAVKCFAEYGKSADYNLLRLSEEAADQPGACAKYNVTQAGGSDSTLISALGQVGYSLKDSMTTEFFCKTGTKLLGAMLAMTGSAVDETMCAATAPMCRFVKNALPPPTAPTPATPSAASAAALAAGAAALAAGALALL